MEREREELVIENKERREQGEVEETANDDREEEEERRKMELVNYEKKTVDFSALRTTDIPFNARVFIPKMMRPVTEMRLNYAQTKIIEECEDYIVLVAEEETEI